MTESTARLALPLLQPGQAQKELYHNEALALIDIAVAASVEAIGVNTPPSGPVIGQCWVVGASPTDDWAGEAHSLAGWTAGGWRFVSALPGMTVWSRADHLVACFYNDNWVLGEVRAARVMVAGQQVVGARLAAIPAPAGGSVVDSEARAALTAILGMLRTHGLIES
jgi:hypothetical protein